MADWLHCNTCFCQPGEGVKFLLTNCGHMYCEECMKKMSSGGVCYMCKSSYTTTPMTNAEMSAENAIFLSNPIELLGNIFEKLQKTLKVMDFQQRHRQRFTAYLRDKVSKQSHMLHQARTSIQRIKEYEMQIGKLKEENMYLKKKYSDHDRQVALLKEENLYLKKLWGKGSTTPGRTSPRTSPVPVSVTATTPRKRSSPLPTQSETTTPKSYLTRISPYSQHGKSVSHMAYQSPNVTTGRVLVKTPPYTQSRPGQGLHVDTHASWSGMHTPVSTPVRRVATPGPNRGSPSSSPMDLGRESPTAPGSAHSSRSQSAHRNFPSRLR